jgi:hypothetical protein
MIKRIALFILAHMAFLGVAAAIVAASTTGADAQRSDNPYDMRFVTTRNNPCALVRKWTVPFQER